MQRHKVEQIVGNREVCNRLRAAGQTYAVFIEMFCLSNALLMLGDGGGVAVDNAHAVAVCELIYLIGFCSEYRISVGADGLSPSLAELVGNLAANESLHRHSRGGAFGVRSVITHAVLSNTVFHRTANQVIAV